MSVYSPADREVLDLLASRLSAHYPDLLAADVRVTVLMASPKEGSDAPALKHHGRAALGLIRVVSTKDRAAGLADCVMYLDEPWWLGAGDEQKAALIDHELHHIELVLDDGGKVRTDDVGRPKVKLRQHDWEVAGFEAIARRHQGHSEEVRQTHALAEAFGQLLFPWAR